MKDTILIISVLVSALFCVGIVCIYPKRDFLSGGARYLIVLSYALGFVLGINTIAAML